MGKGKSMKIFVILSMIFFHIVGDYVVQGCLADLKQRSWWENNYPDKKYRYDYIAALLMHSLCWTFLVMLPIAVFYLFNVTWWFVLCFVIHTIIHVSVDNMKANEGIINLCVDQGLHMLQIVLIAGMLL